MLPTAPQPLSFLHGVFIATDALGGAQLVVDGPYCVMDKAEVQYGHNLRCSLFSPLDCSRVSFTLRERFVEEVASVAIDRAPKVDAILEQVQGRAGVEVVLTTAFDFLHLTELPLEALARSRSEAGGPPVLHVPSMSLGGDWLDGYAGVLETLAREVPLVAGRARPGRVAIVGYLWDRTELDHVGNVRELERLLAPLGLEICSTWLSGQAFADLPRVEEAEWILSLPYGREAARCLGARLGVEVIEADLPVGLGATERLVTRIADEPAIRPHEIAVKMPAPVNGCACPAASPQSSARSLEADGIAPQTGMAPPVERIGSVDETLPASSS